MPEGPFGFPRLTEIGPFSSLTDVERFARRIQRITEGDEEVNIVDVGDTASGRDGVAVQTKLFEESIIDDMLASTVYILDKETGEVLTLEIRTPYYRTEGGQDISNELTELARGVITGVLGDVEIVNPSPMGGHQIEPAGIRIEKSSTTSLDDTEVPIARLHLTATNVSPDESADMTKKLLEELKNSDLIRVNNISIY